MQTDIRELTEQEAIEVSGGRTPRLDAALARLRANRNAILSRAVRANGGRALNGQLIQRRALARRQARIDARRR